MLNTYKKFLIYKATIEDENINSIAKKFNVSKKLIYEIKREGFFKIKDKEKIILDYIEKNPITTVEDISKALKLSNFLVRRILKRYNVLSSKFIQKGSEEEEIVKFLFEREDYKTLNDFLYYNNLEFENNIIDLSKFETKFEYLRCISLLHKFSKLVDISIELEELLSELKNKNMHHTYLRLLALKTAFLLDKRDFKSVIEIIEGLEFDKCISYSLRAEFYMSYLEALSVMEDYKKLSVILSKLERIYDKLDPTQKYEVKNSMSYAYSNIGDYKKAHKFSQDGSIIRVATLYNLGRYDEVINYKFEFPIGRFKSAYITIASISHVLSGNPKAAIETFLSVFKSDELKVEFQKEYYYNFMIIYHKYLSSDDYLEYFERYKIELGDKVSRHFYAIVTGDTSILGNAIKDNFIKYYFQGRMNLVVKMSEKYGMKSILHLLLLFHPKPYSVIAKYKELQDLLKLARRPKIKLYLLKKRPYILYRNRKFYLKSQGLSIEIIKLLINSKVSIWRFSKQDIKRMKYEFKLPIRKTGSEIVLNADVYLDFKEVELSYKLGETKKFNSLFKSLPFDLDHHSDETINNIIQTFKSFQNTT